MFFVYFLTIIIVGVWLLKIINLKSIFINRTPLDIPILLFFGSQILSTAFSIDLHTSIWGYYSRQNGGILSLISYLLLYYAFVSNFKKEDILKFLKAALFGGFLVSLYAIPEHFGVSPSCIILVKRFAADCWIQDVQARVFATLGQPNWLAAYLGMLIFPCIYFIIQAKTLKTQVPYFILLAAYYLAFTFTYSRGATLGVLGGFGILFLGYFFGHPEAVKRPKDIFFSSLRMTFLKPLLLASCLMLLINLLFGSALTGDFRLIKQAAPPPRPGISLVQASGGTQLENGGTESGQIRLIVWKGAFEIFKHYPILGSGLETFAYSYYNFRPKEHNFVSEWDFLYNKAHNEFLNYLATTGALGFGTYMLMLGFFIFWCIRYVLIQTKNSLDSRLLTLVLLASYISYLIQNFFLFSVVIIALLFYLIPGFVFVYTDSVRPLDSKFVSSLLNFIGKRLIFRVIVIILIIFICLSLILSLGKIWLGDTFYKNGSDYSDLGNPGRAYNNLVSAVELNPGEPLYRNELGFAAASAAVALEEEDASTSASLKDEAIDQTEKSLRMSPANLSLWRTAIRTFYQLTALDPKFSEITLTTVDQAIRLAPTDPKLYYNKGLILHQEGKSEKAVEELKKAVELRPNYVEAIITLAGAYEKLEEYKNAQIEYEKALKYVPNDEEIIKKVEELKNK